MGFLQKIKSRAESVRETSMARKGQVGSWGGIAMAVGGGVLGIAVLAIVLQAFRDSQTVNSSAYNITQGGLSFLTNATEQFGTAGTILGVMLIVAIVGIFGFLGYQQLGKRR